MARRFHNWLGIAAMTLAFASTAAAQEPTPATHEAEQQRAALEKEEQELRALRQTLAIARRRAEVEGEQRIKEMEKIVLDLKLASTALPNGLPVPSRIQAMRSQLAEKYAALDRRIAFVDQLLARNKGLLDAPVRQQPQVPAPVSAVPVTDDDRRLQRLGGQAGLGLWNGIGFDAMPRATRRLRERAVNHLVAGDDRRALWTAKKLGDEGDRVASRSVYALAYCVRGDYVRASRWSHRIDEAQRLRVIEACTSSLTPTPAPAPARKQAPAPVRKPAPAPL